MVLITILRGARAQVVDQQWYQAGTVLLPLQRFHVLRDTLEFLELLPERIGSPLPARISSALLIASLNSNPSLCVIMLTPLPATPQVWQ
jgi:hypothetical protein